MVKTKPKRKKTGGGSRKGIPNKATAKREAEIAASGLTPLEFMLQVLRNPKRPTDVRLEAARSAAPYVHPKLAHLVVTPPPAKPPEGTSIQPEAELIGAYFKRLGELAASRAPAHPDPGPGARVDEDRRGPSQPSADPRSRKG